MSKPLIDQYYNNLDRAIQFGKSKNETSIRNYFWNLLNDYARKYNYEVVTEVSCRGTKGRNVKPDGILKNLFGMDVGLWESKDEKTDLNDEINIKIKNGYPLTNILFEDSATAILYQRGIEVSRVSMRQPDKLHQVITDWVTFKSESIADFEIALEKFKADIPELVKVFRKKIDEASKHNDKFIEASAAFLELCKEEINPDIVEADIREMMIQHILTSDIFNKIFDDPEFHKHNNIAGELEKLIEILFTYSERKNLLHTIEHYYDAINAAAASVVDHHEKQKFLKVLYENFYKVYNPKAADRLGVVYTPNEIVSFMVESVDHLLHKNFNKSLSDKNVDILDPATGTGTFVTSIVDYIPKQSLAYKYQNEIHANEVAILPYYIANLNMEFTFKQKMGYYDEFKNLCFVDTLDNTAGLKYKGKQQSMFGISSENAERIKRQNSKRISVIIGNPPYNALQLNANDNNANRKYPMIDKRIKETYAKDSTATNLTKLWDMYVRFYRWSIDRLDRNGVLCFITNRSFIDGRIFDGFRKHIETDFQHCYIIDTKSDVRANPKIAGTSHNVFGIQTGVAIMLLVKKEKQVGKCKIEYISLPDEMRKEDKLEWLRNNRMPNINFERINPDAKGNWLNISDNDWDNLIPLVDEDTRRSKREIDEKALFKLYSLGINTGKSEWLYDYNDDDLEKKVKYYIDYYEKERKRWNKAQKNKDTKIKDFLGRGIKWTSELEEHLEKNIPISYNRKNIITAYWRPYTKRSLYFQKDLIQRTYQWANIYNADDKKENRIICFSSIGSNKDFHCFAINTITDLQITQNGQCVSMYRYDSEGNRIENITNWGLEKFRSHYKDKKITKESIFNYIYGVFNTPTYGIEYAQNLKREFPRIPFFKDFWKTSKTGQELLDLHINFEKAKKFPLKVVKVTSSISKGKQEEMFDEVKPLFKTEARAKSKLKAVKERGEIELDDETVIQGIPNEAWDYKLGSRSALEWVLDQYKEVKQTDKTLHEKFDTYRFEDYKDQVIDLLKKVTTVSIETMKILDTLH